MRLSNLRYYKRYRMELDLRDWLPEATPLPAGYTLVPWSEDLLYEHAEAKHRSFREELDSVLFPCFNDLHACWRLMREIREKKGFSPEATWLLRYEAPRALGRELRPTADFVENCGTIQAIRTHRGRASIQNIGVTPRHRSLGLGQRLIEASLGGLRRSGVTRVALEVTAENHGAVRLYRRLGFRAVRTLYKAVEFGLDAAI